MKKQMKFLFSLPLLAALLTLAVQSWAATRMPSFALVSVRDGEIVDSKSFNGKVLLLTFFATWCPPCAEEIPVLVKLQDGDRVVG